MSAETIDLAIRYGVLALIALTALWYTGKQIKGKKP